jgi:hypothetical protein
MSTRPFDSGCRERLDNADQYTIASIMLNSIGSNAISNGVQHGCDASERHGQVLLHFFSPLPGVIRESTLDFVVVSSSTIPRPTARI